LTGKKNRQTKNKLVKALVDTGVSESTISLKAAKGLPLSSKTETKKWSTAAGLLNTSVRTKRLEFSLTETKKWSTAAGLLNTSVRTKRLEFSLTELQANRKIKIYPLMPDWSVVSE
jgi:predicted aspartyl protease